MTYELLITETQKCLLTFDTEEEAFAVRERINNSHKLEDDEFDEYMDWLYNDILTGWEVETVAEVL